MSVIAAQTSEAVSPALQIIVDEAVKALVERVFEESLKISPTPFNREIAEALRVNLGEGAVIAWQDLVEELGF